MLFEHKREGHFSDDSASLKQLALSCDLYCHLPQCYTKIGAPPPPGLETEVIINDSQNVEKELLLINGEKQIQVLESGKLNNGVKKYYKQDGNKHQDLKESHQCPLKLMKAWLLKLNELKNCWGESGRGKIQEVKIQGDRFANKNIGKESLWDSVGQLNFILITQ